MITSENITQFGIGSNFQYPLVPLDIDGIVYGADIGDSSFTLEDPSMSPGETPYWKEPSYNKWWKVGPLPEGT